MTALLNGPYGPTPLGINSLTIGSTPDNQLVIPDARVSPRHAEVRLTSQGYTVTDFGNPIGTFVNGQRLEYGIPRVLKPGDTIRIGDATYTYTEQNDPVVAPAPAYPDYNYSSYDPTQRSSYTPSSGGEWSAHSQYPPFEQDQQGGSATPSIPPPPPYPAYNDPAYNAASQTVSNSSAPPPVSYVPPSSSLPGYTPPPSSGRGPRRNPLQIIILAAIAFILVVGGLVAYLLYQSNATTVANNHATATALTTGGLTATAFANSTATTLAQNNAANATATATVSVSLNATATALGNDNATATAFANFPEPYTKTGKLAYYDVLKDNSKGANWPQNSNCGFLTTSSGTSYNISEDSKNTFFPCVTSLSFDNFVYEIYMGIYKGDCGGAIFRSANSREYIYQVCQDGNYSLYTYDGKDTTYVIRPTQNSSIKTGYSNINVLAVVAKGDTIQLYANSTSLTTIHDSYSSQGSIGAVAVDLDNSTAVIYGYAKVWKL